MTTINLQNQVKSKLQHMPLIIGAKGIPKIKVKPVTAKSRPQNAPVAQNTTGQSLNKMRRIVVKPTVQAIDKVKVDQLIQQDQPEQKPVV